MVTVAGHPGDDFAPRTLSSILKQPGLMKILIVVERTETGFSAYSPDLPGCVATGASQSEVERTMKEAIDLHFDGLRADGLTPPEPHTYATVVEVAA